MTDHRILQRSKAKQDGRELIATDVTWEKFRAGKWPVGSTHLWSTEEVWGPVKKKEKAA
ncbi:hypothetical protein J2Y63_002420 [Shinella sp. BE166]|uniref:hypothetical protein n=1 Tax=Shinella sp. BE166 TaxID=3373918 RepID=UPI003EB70914